MRALFALLWLACAALPARAQFKMQNAAGEAPGPWLFGTIGVGRSADGKPLTTALKGLAVKVGAHGEAAVCYDLDLCRMAGGWSGGKFVTPMNLMSRGDYPTALGPAAFLTAESAGFLEKAEPWRDPREEPFGSLPGVRYRGLFVHGDRVVLRWQIGPTEVLESPGYELRKGLEVYTRTFTVAPSAEPVRIVVCRLPEGAAAPLVDGIAFFSATVDAPLIERTGFAKFTVGDRVVAATDYELPEGSAWKEIDRQLVVEIPPRKVPAHFRLLVGAGPVKTDTIPPLIAEPPLEDLAAWCQGGPAHWPESVETKGEPAAPSEEPYVVDTIRLPDPNPWGAPLFVGGLDFFPDGRAAISTFHGDVFIASGIDGSLEHVVWKRFASGLYHPLGLKIVQGEIYVSGRDGITRLRDLNGDGEADSYEAFNRDVKVTKSFHEFVFDLQTDPAGNFYFTKAGPVKNGGRGFDQICEHHGCLFRVSPDGAKMEVLATGFRAPNGMGVGPYGEITTGDNEGTWTPVCRLNWITPGGFYGVVDLAHRPQPPTDYDKPLCWLPKRVDNSSGGQVWVDSPKWGPWSGHLLHLSYGQCALFGVMSEGVQIPEAPDCCSHIMQGGVVKFPLKFESGIMRARFSPLDGQLYLAGLRGWQTTGVKNGCLQRVRYTGKPVAMPLELSARQGGVQVKFSASLNTQQAADPENWSVEVWNYLWTSAYGSPEVSTLTPAEKTEGEYTPAQMKKAQHDPLVIKSVSIGSDDRTVFLEIPNLKPVMQMSIRYQLHTSEGAELSGEIVNTINALQPAP